MDSEEEMESFEITENDFFTSGYKRKFTKEDAMLGIWAPRDDTKNRGGNKDYSAPVSFVSAQHQVEEEEEDDSNDEDNIDEQIEYIFEKDKKDTSVKSDFNVPKLQKNRQLHMFETVATPTAPTKGKTTPKSVADKRKRELMVSDRDWGNWEKFSSGFAGRMMKKMGYVPGKGLGKKGEGIVNPVKAVKTVELGNSGPELLDTSKTVEEEQEEEEMFQQELQQWQKLDNNSSRPKYVYKTLNELRESDKRRPYNKKLQRSGVQTQSDNKVKVIDMRGKETKVLNSYSDIRNENKTSYDNVYVPELLHNLELLVTDTESDIITNDHQLQYNQDMIVNLSHESERLEQVIGEEKNQVEKLTEINNIVLMFEDSLSKGSTLTLYDCQEILSQLQLKYPLEYKIYDLSSIAVAVVFPMIKRLLEGWDMLSDPSGPFKVFQQWRELLRESEYTASVPPETEKMDAYDRLIWEVWMIKLRRLLSNWGPRQESPVVISLLEIWMPLLPEWIICNILEAIILPKLQTEVDNWNPTTDPIPIHSWIHPWLPLMDKQLEVLFPAIRMKMGVALNNWQPSDSSALVIMRPWINVFSKEVMEAFLCRTVLPKLDYTLQSMIINPQHQIIAPVQWVLQWREALPIHHFVHMFNKHFFPKWLQVLNDWLSGSPNYDEVVKWYTGWKGLFDKEMLSDPSIKANFNHALTLMDHAAHGTLVPGMRENMVCFTTSERRRTAGESQVTHKVHKEATATTVSFKDVIEKKAEELGIVFVPMSKRYEGKQLHSFGDFTVYIDRGVLFVMNEKNQWTPISLDELVNRTMS